MFETLAIGHLVKDPTPKRVKLPSGDVANVVELVIYFNGLKAIVPNEKGEKMEKNVASKISVWDEKDQKWLLEKAKKGSSIQINGMPKLGVFFNKRSNHWDVALEFSKPDCVKFRSLGSNGRTSAEMTGKSETPPITHEKTPEPPSEPESTVGSQGDPTPDDYQKLFAGVNQIFSKDQSNAG